MKFKANSVCLHFSLKPLLKKIHKKLVPLSHDVTVRNAKDVKCKRCYLFSRKGRLFSTFI